MAAFNDIASSASPLVALCFEGEGYQTQNLIDLFEDDAPKVKIRRLEDVDRAVAHAFLPPARSSTTPSSRFGTAHAPLFKLDKVLPYMIVKLCQSSDRPLVLSFTELARLIEQLSSVWTTEVRHHFDKQLSLASLLSKPLNEDTFLQAERKAAQDELYSFHPCNELYVGLRPKSKVLENARLYGLRQVASVAFIDAVTEQTLPTLLWESVMWAAETKVRYSLLRLFDDGDSDRTTRALLLVLHNENDGASVDNVADCTQEKEEQAEEAPDLIENRSIRIDVCVDLVPSLQHQSPRVFTGLTSVPLVMKVLDDMSIFNLVKLLASAVNEQLDGDESLGVALSDSNIASLAIKLSGESAAELLKRGDAGWETEQLFARLPKLKTRLIEEKEPSFEATLGVKAPASTVSILCPNPVDPEKARQLTELAKRVPIFPQQRAVAERLFHRIAFVLEKQGKSLSEYQGVQCLLLVPSFNSLLNQTRLRVDNSVSCPHIVMMNNISAANNQLFDGFKKRALDNEHVLFVIISDESHFAPMKGQAHDNFINDTKLLECKNVIVLQVSATPYANLTRQSRIPERYVMFESDNYKGTGIVEVGGSELGNTTKAALEELHVVRWYAKSNNGCESPYLRMEHLLETVPSKLRHDVVGRCRDGRGEPPPAIERPVTTQLIRKDLSFEDVLELLKVPAADRHIYLIVDYIMAMSFQSLHELYQRDAREGANYSEEVQFVSRRLRERFEWACCECVSVDHQPKLRNAGEKLQTLILSSAEKEMHPNIAGLGETATAPVPEEEVWKYIVTEKLKAAGAERVTSDNISWFTESDRIVKDLCRYDGKRRRRCGDGHMKVVRVANNADGDVMFTALKKARDLLWDREHSAAGSPHLPSHSSAPDAESARAWQYPPFTILRDFGTSKIKDSIEHAFLDFPVPASVLDPKLEGYYKLKELKDVLKDSLSYVHLEGVPCILILCEKGRMGDSFPQSFDCLDLRIRTSDNNCTLVQELGRLCRYPTMNMKQVLPSSDDKKCAEVFAEGRAVGVEVRGATPANNDDEAFLGYAWSVKSWANTCNARAVVRGVMSDGVALSPGRDALLVYPSSPYFDRIGALSDEALKDCRVVVYAGKSQDGAQRCEEELKWVEEGICLEISDVTHSETQDLHLKLTCAVPLEMSKAKARPCLKFILLQDQSSLAYYRCQVNRDLLPQLRFREVKQHFPYALILDSVYDELCQAVDRADAFGMEIWRCIQVREGLDRNIKRAERRRLKSFPDIRYYHNYRETWCAGDDHFDVTEDRSKRLEKDLHPRRFLLSAECQIGKTGAYCHLLNLLLEEVTQVRLEGLSDIEEVKHENIGSGGSSSSSDTVSPGKKLDHLHWLAPFWDSPPIASAKWDVNILCGKYHTKVMFQRLAMLLRAESRTQGRPQAEFVDNLVALIGGAKGECVQSKLLSSRLESMRTALIARGRVVWWQQSEKRFKILDQIAFRHVLNWDRPDPQQDDHFAVYSHKRFDEVIVDPLLEEVRGIQLCTMSTALGEPGDHRLYTLHPGLYDFTVQHTAWPSSPSAASSTLTFQRVPSTEAHKPGAFHPFHARPLLRAGPDGGSANTWSSSVYGLASTLRDIDASSLFDVDAVKFYIPQQLRKFFRFLQMGLCKKRSPPCHPAKMQGTTILGCSLPLLSGTPSWTGLGCWTARGRWQLLTGVG